jgi:kinesin family protein 5
MNRFLKSSKSLGLNKLNPYYYYSTPKKNNSKINLYNIGYLEKSPTSNIKVFCKFRPLNEIESMCSEKEMIKIDSSKHLLLKTENPSKSIQEFTFDEIFKPNSHKLSFYNKACKNIVSHTMQGYNGGIIFYGESGTGKTYTIKQIIPQIISQIYEEIGLSDSENELYKIQSSVYEIYKEQINDLLHMKNINLNLIELKNKNVIVNNLTYYEVNNEEELNDIISQGLTNKIKYNNNIKSHFIIEIKIYKYCKDKNIMKCGTLHIVELEGIEGFCSEIEINDEQKMINKSISALKWL